MGSATFQPKWWSEKHSSQWENVKEALKRDWEQTKADLHIVGGRDRHQEVADTLKQAAGAEPIPESNAWGTAPGTDFTWDQTEELLMYGVGARQQYGDQYAQWDKQIEAMLRTDWENAGRPRHWDEVKNIVRHGYNH